MSSPAADAGAPGVTRAGTGSPVGQQPAMLLRGAEDLPWLDLAVLAELEEDLGSPDIAWNFAQDYIRIWRRRRDALAAGLERGERSAALDAVISLRISAAMIGGLRLAHLAQTLHALIQEGDLERCVSLLPRVDDYGTATVHEIQHKYLARAEQSQAPAPFSAS
ncbi:Hpt domain-containing protein [Arthrobacter sp. Leaf337]|uniref:Hpt domain-containing protein n=1 Tax=Arthrobacter sp. Leaf337 TaxID=1736342 RepID=UPI0012E26415|nr:Hpt domain-containing protein [Arthrobacter sp. Leaf337]